MAKSSHAGWMAVDQSATYCPPPSCVLRAPIYKRVPMTTLRCHSLLVTYIPFAPFPHHHPSLTAQTTPMMADLTKNTTTAVDARGSLGHQEHPWADSGTGVGIPKTTFSYVFRAQQPVLIWYIRDGFWHEGVIVCSRPKHCQVEFCAGGPRIRNWYKALCGVIRPDTPNERDALKVQGYTIIPRAPRL